MIKDGALENPKPAAIYGLHVMPAIPIGQAHVGPGAFMASVEEFQIEVFGKSSHGALPQDGIDSVVVSAAIVTALQTIRSRRIDPLESIVLSVGSIHGGNRYNILADRVVLVGTIRTLDEKTRKRVGELVKQVVDSTAAAYGATAKVTILQNALVTTNTPALVPSVEKSLARVLGADSSRARSRRWSAKTSRTTRRSPACSSTSASATHSAGITAVNHTAAFDIDEAGLVLGVRWLATIAVDALMPPAVATSTP